MTVQQEGRPAPSPGEPLRRATIESVFSGVGAQALLLVSGVLSARLLGVEGRGALALLILFPLLVSQLGGLGLPQALTYHCRRHTHRAAHLVRRIRPSIIALMLVMPLLHGLVLLLYFAPDSKDILDAALITLAVTPALLAQNVGLALLQGVGRYRAFNVLRVTHAAAYAAGLIVFLLVDDVDLRAVVALWVLANVLVGWSTLLFGLRVAASCSDVSEGDTAQALPTQGDMLRFGLKGMIGAISPFDTFRLDQLVVGLLLSPFALGLYVTGQAFSNLPRFIGRSVGMIAHPALAATESGAAQLAMSRKFVLSAALINLALVIPLIALIPYLLPLLFGEAFRGAVTIAQILVAAGFLSALRAVYVECLRGRGLPGISTYSEIASYPLFAIGLVWALPRGIVALATVVLLVQLGSLMLAWALGRRR